MFNLILLAALIIAVFLSSLAFKNLGQIKSLALGLFLAPAVAEILFKVARASFIYWHDRRSFDFVIYLAACLTGAFLLLVGDFIYRHLKQKDSN
jgi:hypothetical protein